jgi:hypothetical protein
MQTPLRRGWLRRLNQWALPPAQPPQPDHDFYIRADMGPCCSWHSDRAFRPRTTGPIYLDLEREPEPDPGVTPQMRAYINAHLGDRRR